MSKNYSNNKSNGRSKQDKNKFNHSKSQRNDRDYSQRVSDSDIRDDRIVGRPSHQHPDWYLANPELVEATMRIPTKPFAGKPIKLYSEKGVQKMNTVVPGIMALDYVPIPGTTNSSTDAMNIAAQNIFQLMRKKLSTVASYGPADVMMMILAIDGVYMKISELTRLYGMVNAWNSDNYYLPFDLICAAMNWSKSQVQDLIDNQAEFRTRLNTLIYKAATLYSPYDFNIIKRHNWLVSNVFADDGANARAQYYVTRVRYWPILDETTLDTGTAIRYEQLLGGDWQDQLKDLNDMIELIRNSDSFTLIMSDMRRAFEDRPSWSLSYVPENYLVTAMVDPYFKEQLHNAVLPFGTAPAELVAPIKPGTIAPSKDETYSGQFYIFQSVDTNVIYSEPYLRIASQYDNTETSDYTPFSLSSGDKFINTYTSDLDTKMLSEVTRSMSLCYPVSNWSNTVHVAKVESAGGDILIGMYVYFHNDNADPTVVPTVQIVGSPYSSSAIGELGTNLYATLPFDYSPMVYYCEGDGSELMPMTEIDYYTVLPWSTLELMNEVIMTSMWKIPELNDRVAHG